MNLVLICKSPSEWKIKDTTTGLVFNETFNNKQSAAAKLVKLRNEHIRGTAIGHIKQAASYVFQGIFGEENVLDRIAKDDDEYKQAKRELKSGQVTIETEGVTVEEPSTNPRLRKQT